MLPHQGQSNEMSSFCFCKCTAVRMVMTRCVFSCHGHDLRYCNQHFQFRLLQFCTSGADVQRIKQCLTVTMKVELTLLIPLGLPGVGDAHFENCCIEMTASILFFCLLIFGLLDYYYYMFILYLLSQCFYMFYFLPFVFLS